VLAHELAHIVHGDVWFAGPLLAPVTVLRAALAKENWERDEVLGRVFFAVVLAPLYAITLVCARGLIRARELAADRTGALILGSPSAMQAALVAADAASAAGRSADLRASALAFVAPNPPQTGIRRLADTHPTLTTRLRHLDTLAAQLGRRRAP
jgi:heat shock protein HtpX